MRLREGTVGYMCMIDFEDELYRAAGGNIVYPSIEDLKENHDCWKQCGIVAVRVELVEVVVPQNLWKTE